MISIQLERWGGPSFKALRRRMLHDRQTPPNDLEATISAMARHRQAESIPAIAEEERQLLLQLARGRRGELREMQERREAGEDDDSDDGEPRPGLPRGAVVPEKLDALLRWMRKKKATEEDRFAMEMCFATGLRASQMKTLSFGAVRKVGHGDDARFEVVAKRIHNPRANRADKIVLLHIPVHRRVWPKLQALIDVNEELGGDAAELVCPHWDARRLGAYIKRAAEALKWTRTAAWKGVHVLRHGRAVSLAEETSALEASLALGHRLPQQASATTTRYITPLDRRRPRHA